MIAEAGWHDLAKIFSGTALFSLQNSQLAPSPRLTQSLGMGTFSQVNAASVAPTEHVFAQEGKPGPCHECLLGKFMRLSLESKAPVQRVGIYTVYDYIYIYMFENRNP